MSEMNIALSILKIYPNLQPFVDFRCVNEDGVQSVAEWNNTNPEPSNDQLQTAWFEVLKDDKIEELNQERDSALMCGFRSSALGTEHIYPSHDKAQTNFNTEMQRFLTDSNYTTCKFFTEDAGYLEHTKDQFFKAFADGHDYGNAQWDKFFSLYAEVKTLTYPTNTEADLDAITW